ncbi:MAG: hypothetical protein ABWZ82_01440, partial [Candidatus Limnocylindrales bacterium]
DVSVIGTSDLPNLMFGIRIKGSEVDPFVESLVPILVPGASSPQPAQIAGKDVSVVTNVSTLSGTTLTWYVYPRNDVLWIISWTEPGLTEILQKLP